MDIQEKFLKHYGEKKISQFSRDFKENFLSNQNLLNEVFDWCNFDNLKKIKLLINFLEDDSFDCNKLNCDALFDTMIHFYVPSYEVLESVVYLFKLVSKKNILMNIIHNFENYSEFSYPNILLYSIIHDSERFSLENFFVDYKISYDMNQRFSGLLPMLYYLGYFDLYETMFEVALEIIYKSFEYFKDAFISLFSFVSIVDKSKNNKMFDLISKIKNKYNNFEWIFDEKFPRMYTCKSKNLVDSNLLKILEEI